MGARLPNREDSERSWTVDFAARRAEAQTQAEPHRREEQRLKEKQLRLKEKLLALKAELRADPKADKTPLDALNLEIAQTDRAARDAAAKAQTIEDAIYDIKAVNPNAKVETDNRTSAEPIQLIEAKGAEVLAALVRLKAIS